MRKERDETVMQTVEVSVFREDYAFEDSERLVFPVFDKSFVVERLSPSSLRFLKTAGEDVLTDSIISVNVKRASFTLDPRLLDRPIVLSFNVRVIVHPGTEAALYLHLPLDLSLILKSQDARIPVGDLIGEDFLTSCFGPPEIGQVCYLFYTDVRWSEAELSEPNSFFAVVPLTVRNVSRETIDVAKIVVEPWLLNLYERDGRIFTSPIKFRISSPHSGTVVYSKDAPHEGDTPVACNRKSPPKRFRERVMPWLARRRKIHYFKD